MALMRRDEQTEESVCLRKKDSGKADPWLSPAGGTINRSYHQDS